MLKHFAFVCAAVTLTWSQPALSQNKSAQKKPSRRVVKAEDMPRIPHTPAAKAVQTFQQARGFSLELVASEPLVSDPVDACFDEFGRMFVAEMHGYPFSQEPTRLNPNGGGKRDAGIIRLLEDTDGDGKMDKSTVFADKLSWPTSVRCFNGGVFVIAPAYLYYLKDTDGDGKADVRDVVLNGFGRDNVQSVTNGLHWGLDNKIYFAAGRNPKRLLHRGKSLPNTNGVDLRFDPRTEKFERVSGGLQFGHTMDDWGTRFVCSNSNHIQQVVFPLEYLERNPLLAASGLVRSIASDGASARVFRTSPPEPWRIIRQKWRAEAKGYKLVINKDGGWEFLPLDPSKKKGTVPTEYPVGFFTSATGITIYRGDAYPAEFHGNAFVGDVGGNLVHRKTVKTDGIVYSAKRADAGTEFLRSRDNWFRPVNFVNAPDGSLYVLDMYRETVEHPYSIPEEIKAFLHLTSGIDRGRIYRLVSPGMKRRPAKRLGDLPLHALVSELGSANGWNRVTAQRLLFERQDRKSIPYIERFLEETNSPLGRLHALYSLQGLGVLAPRHLKRALEDDHPRLRAHAIKLAEPLLDSSADLLASVATLASDDNPHVRFQLAFSLGASNKRTALAALARLARDPRNAGDIQIAVLSSVGTTADKLCVEIIKSAKQSPAAHAAQIVSRLGVIVGSNSNTAGTMTLLSALAEAEIPLSLKQTVISGIGQGLARRGTSLGVLLMDKNTPISVKRRVGQVFDRAAATSIDESKSLSEREEAIRLLGYGNSPLSRKHLGSFLTPVHPQQIQRAAIAALGRQNGSDVPRIVLAGWQSYSPAVRRDAIDILMTQSSRIKALLDQVADSKIKPRDIERDKKQQLMSHPTATIRVQARQLFGRGVLSDRARVVKDYQDVLTLKGVAARGEMVFRKRCSVCHRVGNVGHRVAPELSSVQNKSPADLLVSILDPNREAQPNFNVYSVVTDKGRIYNGIISAETTTSITLTRAEAKQDVVLRSTIDRLISTGVSLMPVGLEKDLSKQDLADVIAFIKTIKAPASGEKKR